MPNKADFRRFRAIGHSLKTIITIASNGISKNVMAEINRALDDHELIKIRVHEADRKARDLAFARIVKQSKGRLIQSIGNVALIYKPAAKPNPKLSNILRAKIL